MATIGFVHSQQRKGYVAGQKGLLLQCDSGTGVPFADACHNTIVFGGTGSGKTSSVMLPALAGLLEAGHAGLVADIKGNLGGQLRLLAKNRGRESDIVEFGSFASAVPVDILEGLSLTDRTGLLRILAVNQFGAESRNLEWCLKGVRIAADVLELLDYLRAHDPRIPGGLVALEKILNDYRLAARLFGLFMRVVHDPANAAHVRFANRINNEQFHVLSYDAKKKDNTSYNEQATWRLQGIRAGLLEFLEAPGVSSNFATQGMAGVDLKRLIYDEKKVVLLRFGVDTGPIGAWLTRHVLERFHKTVYANGLGLGPDEYVFIVGDEFQDFINLAPGNRMNDNVFTAKAREFRVIQLVATQSLSALSSRGASSSAVMEFANNCNNRVLMHCDDPSTQAMSERYEPDIALNQLGSGECMLLRFDLATRRHIHSKETLQMGHDALQKELRQAGETIAANGPEAGYAQPVPETDLMDIFSVIEEEKKALRKEGKRADRTIDDDPQPENIVQRQKRLSEMKVENDDAATGTDSLPLALQKVIGKYPEFFPQIDGKKMSMPAGWITALDKVLEGMRQTGLPLTIQALRLRSGGSLGVSNATSAYGYSADMAIRLCNRLLEVTLEICPICGKRIAPPNEWGHEFMERGFCAECLRAYDIMPSYAPLRGREETVMSGM